jgi:hypothetical protein
MRFPFSFWGAGAVGGGPPPFDPSTDALWLFEPGNYAASGGPPPTAWTWTATVGPNITEGGGGAGPSASGGNDPAFDDASNIRTTSATTIDDMFGPLDGSAFDRSGFVTATVNAAGAANADPSLEDHFWADLSYGAIGLGVHTTAGTTTAQFWILNDDYRIAAVDIAVSTRTTIHWRIHWDGAAGYIQIGIDGTWQSTVAISTAIDATVSTKKFIFGANRSSVKLLDGPIHAAGFYDQIKDDAFFDDVVAEYA